MNLPQTDRLSMITSENDAEADDTSNDLASSSRKRSSDALGYPRKRATIAVLVPLREIPSGTLTLDSANFAGGESRAAMAQDQGASCAPNYALNASIENRV
jgi:hypothetical protein